MSDHSTISIEETEERRAAWERVLKAHAPLTEHETEWFRVARAGHQNCVAMLRISLIDVSGCPCGADDLCAPRLDPPRRAEKRAALESLVALLEGGAR